MQLSVCSHQIFHICRACLLQRSYLQTVTSMNASKAAGLYILSNTPLSSAELEEPKVNFTGSQQMQVMTYSG